MKRDMELIKQILLFTESLPEGKGLGRQAPPIPGYDEQAIQEHVYLLEDSGFIYPRSRDALLPTGFDGLLNRDRMSGKLTWQGHDFLAEAKVPSLWASAMQRVSQLGGSVSMDVFKSLLTQAAKNQLGL
ncbi:DUF2513 domain-containing protein [Planctomicrobium sp. SH661]|uniref:DUF2513 domain-containing protein n=1 Tax=Planctomicrobium sp. SH661 TaxID=3448124 RepID=UPI003F5C9403